MAQFTASISKGAPAEGHNRRDWMTEKKHPAHIDFARTPQNVVLVDRPLEEVYEEQFGAAVELYNYRQREKGHPERQIDDYLVKVKKDKQLKPFYEFVVQVGNMDEHPDTETANAILSQFIEEFQKRYGLNFALKQAIIHNDEATPHLHFEFVPVAESKRGVPVQNSLAKAVKAAGHPDFLNMLGHWEEMLDEAMLAHGIERKAGDKEKQRGGVSMQTFKREIAAEKRIEQAEREIAELSERKECLRHEVEELQPRAQNVLESAKTLFDLRGLENEESELRGRISELERERNAAHERVSALERAIAPIRERVKALAAFFVDKASTVLPQVSGRFSFKPRAIEENSVEFREALNRRVKDHELAEREKFALKKKAPEQAKDVFEEMRESMRAVNRPAPVRHVSHAR